MRTETKCRLTTEPGDIWRVSSTHYTSNDWYMTLGGNYGHRKYIQVDEEGRVKGNARVFHMSGPQVVQVQAEERRSGADRRKCFQPVRYSVYDRRSSPSRRDF